MRKILIYIFVFGCILHIEADAQPDVKDPEFEAKVIRLSVIGDSVLNAREFADRIMYHGKLKAGLDSLLNEDPLYLKKINLIPTISCLVSKDKRLRIVTWQLQNADLFHHNYGIIQYRSKKAGLVKYELIDTNYSTMKPMDTILADTNWYGALYYKLISHKWKKGRTMYTLFGWDGFNKMANRKLIENLHFDKQGNIFFGAQLFHKDIEGKPKRTYYRHFLEYAEDAVVTVNYSNQFEMIMMDHLVPKDGGSRKLTFNLVPDGSYQAFEWKKKKWNFIDKVFHQKFETAPVPEPRKMDERGN